MNLPPEIAALLAQPSLTDAEQNVLAQFLIANQESLSPSDAVRIAGKLGAATTPGTDWQAEATGMGMGVPGSDPAVAWMQQQPGYQAPVLPGLDDLANLGEGGNALTRQPGFGDIPPTTTDGAPDLAAQTMEAYRKRGMPPPPAAQAPGAAPMPAPPTTGPGDDLAAEAVNPGGGPRLSPDTGAVTPPSDFPGRSATAIPGSNLGGMGAGANPLPDRGGGHDRLRERGGGTNWRNEADALGGRLPEESAFAGIEAGMLPTLEANPELAARMLARSRGGGDRAGDLMAPQLTALMNLNQTGILGGRGVGPMGGLQGPANRLGSAEALYNAMGPGSYLDPQSLHRETLRNIRRTDAGTMFGGGEGAAGDINQQVAVTNSAILAAATASMAPDALAAMEARLASAEQEYIMGVVDGSIAPDQMSYPQWLRTEKNVRKWVGPGTTPEQWQQAFSTE